MSSTSYARKARRFVISNPAEDATVGQRNQIGRLLRYKQHDVDYGNAVIELLNGEMNRGQADSIIKTLASNPNNVKAITKAATAEVKTIKTLDPMAAAVEIQMIARKHGIKLGAVAERRLAAHAA